MVSFSVRLFGVPGGPFGGHWVVLGGHLGSFGSHFGDFLEVSGISKNVCFTIVKPYFLRSGRVLDRVFFVSCFWIDTFSVLFTIFLRFGSLQGAHRGSKGSLLGALWVSNCAQFGGSVERFQSCSRGPKSDYFEVILGCLLEVF